MAEGPVTFVPGRPRLCTNPAPTGSALTTKMMGSEVVACRAATAAAVLLATMSSLPSVTSSRARPRSMASSPCANRYSIRRFWPSTYPRSRSPSSRSVYQSFATEVCDLMRATARLSMAPGPSSQDEGDNPTDKVSPPHQLQQRVRPNYHKTPRPEGSMIILPSNGTHQPRRDLRAPAACVW